MENHDHPSVLITGCGKGGIGHALANEFKSKGYKVITTVLTHEPRDHLTDVGIHAFNADVTESEDLEQLRKKVSDLTGEKLHILVNNAGIVYTMAAIDSDVREVEKMFDVNVLGPMRMVQHFHPLLIKAKGKIVNIGSVGGIVPYVYASSYNATKAALHHWGNTLRVEIAPVSVINIISGEVSTNILKRDYERKLPETSFYQPLKDEFVGHVTRTPNATSPKEYAKAVIAEVTRDHPRAWFWTGARTGLVRFGDMFLPRTFWDWAFTKEFNLDKLKTSK